MDDKKFKTILTQFNLKPPFEIQAASSGLINKTFFVKADGVDFVLQELHHIVRPETCLDAREITNYARSKGISVPEYVNSNDGNPFVTAEGVLWRLMKRLPGHSIDTITRPEQAHSAGRLIGLFHTALRTSDYQCRGSIHHFHDTPYIFDQFKMTIKRPEFAELLTGVKKEVDTVLLEVPKQLLPDGLPRQIVHGDLKISNFLFDGPTTAAALLDFDTGMNHSPLIDIGDALRSWCNTAGEDTEKATFNRDIYLSGRMGYTETATLSDEERGLIPQAFRLLVIEQAMRFLKDYFEDNYYGWNPAKFSSRREHNLVRCRGQLSLFEQIKTL